MLETSKGPNYTDKHETRRLDLHRYATEIDSRDVVPVLEGDRLVDATDR
jgi:2-phosphosulfolactate phosphatase